MAGPLPEPTSPGSSGRGHRCQTETVDWRDLPRNADEASAECTAPECTAPASLASAASASACEHAESSAEPGPERKAPGTESSVAETRAGMDPGPPETQPRAVPRWRKGFLFTFAGLFFGLGVLGAILPGLPATPFLLLTSYFLSRCSPRLNVALLNSRLFGPVLTDWQVHGGIRRRVKVKAIVVVVLAVALTIHLSGYSRWASAGVVTLAAIGITVILKLPAAADGDREARFQARIDAERINEAHLRIDNIADGDHWEIKAVGAPCRRIDRGRSGRPHAAAENVGADHKEAVGVDGPAGSDQRRPPAGLVGQWVRIGGVLVTGQRMADENRIGAVGIQRAVGLVGDVEGRQRLPAIEAQRRVRDFAKGAD